MKLTLAHLRADVKKLDIAAVLMGMLFASAVPGSVAVDDDDLSSLFSASELLSPLVPFLSAALLVALPSPQMLAKLLLKVSMSPVMLLIVSKSPHAAVRSRGETQGQ